MKKNLFISAIIIALAFFACTNPPKQLKQKAETGDKIAQYQLAKWYKESQDELYREKDVLKWAKLSAEQGLDSAQYLTGYWYYSQTDMYSEILSEYRDSVVFWFSKAANQGYVEAQYMLGIVYSTKFDFIDKEKAFYWYRKAAWQKHEFSVSKIADCFRDGEGVKQNADSAIFYYRLGAEMFGDLCKYAEIGNMYFEGKGVKINIDSAKIYFQKSVDNGCSSYSDRLEAIKKNGKKALRQYITHEKTGIGKCV